MATTIEVIELSSGEEEQDFIVQKTIKEEGNKEDTNEENKEDTDEDTDADRGYESPLEEVSFLKNDRKIPIFCHGKCDNLSNQVLIDLLLKKKSQRIAVKKPVRVQDNMSFLLDTTKLKNCNDWAADDNGSWENRGYNGTVVLLDENFTVVSSSRMARNTKKRQKLQQNQYVIKRTYYCNKSSPDFRRYATMIEAHDGKKLGMLLLEYWYENEVHPIVIKPHGLAKKNKRSFIPTAPSTKESIKKAVNGTVRGPSRIYDDLFEEVGGMDEFPSTSEIPRNPQQVKRARNLVI
ncbi:uncharacterized protein [Clytia hemisphaerica]|uniref:uncharacterized protein n=1 Tax=Clytia hemisphaerica TaxID=252671 RepID=UPI0034D7B0CE